jgi:ketosteroid isomerase-like protein
MAGLIWGLYGCATSQVVPDATAELLALNEMYDAALEAGDPVMLAKLYADEFEYIGPGAIVRNRQQQIDAFATGAIDLLEGRSDDVKVRQYGDTAVLTGRFRGRVRVSSQEYSFVERYSSVWVREGGQWQMVLEHGTVVPQNVSQESPD